jgi:hypothetical protein
MIVSLLGKSPQKQMIISLLGKSPQSPQKLNIKIYLVFVNTSENV